MMSWWILQLAGAFLVFTAHIVNRKFGLCLTSYLYYSLVSICFTGWMLPLSYQKAPNFFQPWFLGIISLTVFGFCGSILYFHESVAWYNMIGAFLAIIGCVLVAL
jgi:hypothetical protein